MTAALQVPPNLATVTWGGLDLVGTSGDLEAIVTSVEGWYGTPEAETNDVNRDLLDGSLYGPKVIRAREVTISGVALGPREQLMAFRSALASRAVARLPADLTITDPWQQGASTTASVRASSGLTHTFVGHEAFRYQITLVAADPRRYASTWSQAVITLSGGSTTGRSYRRSYPWHYASTDAAGSARLTNPGNVAAPVQALYAGQLSESRLTDDTDTIHVAPIDAGVQILVSTDTLLAQAGGGVTRASYIMAGSTPLLVPPQTTVTWRLLATGTGTVTLYWRGAYS